MHQQQIISAMNGDPCMIQNGSIIQNNQPFIGMLQGGRMQFQKRTSQQTNIKQQTPANQGPRLKQAVSATDAHTPMKAQYLRVA